MMLREEEPAAGPADVIVCSWQYPAPSETFIHDQVLGLRRRGIAAPLLALRLRRTPGQALPLPQVYPWVTQGSASRWPLLPQAARQWLRTVRHQGWAALGRDLRRPAPLEYAARQSQLGAWVGPGTVVHAHFAQQGLLLAHLLEGHLGTVPLVVSLHGFDVNRPLHEGRKPYAPLWARAGAVTVGSEFMRQRAVDLGCPADRLHRIPVGVRCADWEWQPRQATAQRVTRLLSVGRLVPYKGIDDLLQAMVILLAEGADLSLNIVGDGPERPRLESMAMRAGLGAKVRFLGAQSAAEVRAQMQAADIFVYPSKHLGPDAEGQGLAIQEAQASGALVVGTRHGGIPEGIAPQLQPFLAEENKPESLAAGIRALLQAKPSWAALSRAGRSFVEQYFDQPLLLDQSLAVYETLRAAAEKRPCPSH